MYKNTTTEFEYRVETFNPDQFLIDNFKYYEKWEFISPHPESNQIVMRNTWHIEWLNKPFALWPLIEDGLKKRVKQSGEILNAWFTNSA